jgi:hypothetical protein
MHKKKRKSAKKGGSIIISDLHAMVTAATATATVF